MIKLCLNNIIEYKTSHNFADNGQALTIKNVVMLRDLPMNLFYIPFDVISKSVSKWESARVLAPNHPSQKNKVKEYGYLTNPRIDAKKRRILADMVINKPDELKADYPALFNRIISGEPVHGSASLYFGKVIKMLGKAGGKMFNKLVQSIRAVDHYALLNVKAACTPKEGCGVNINFKDGNMKDDNKDLIVISDDSIDKIVTDLFGKMQSLNDKIVTDLFGKMQSFNDSNGGDFSGSTTEDNDKEGEGVTEFSECVKSRFETLEAKLETLQAKFATVEGELATVKGEFSQVETKLKETETELSLVKNSIVGKGNTTPTTTKSKFEVYKGVK